MGVNGRNAAADDESANKMPDITKEIRTGVLTVTRYICHP